jgi:hypothetical protein
VRRVKKTYWMRRERAVTGEESEENIMSEEGEQYSKQ